MDMNRYESSTLPLGQTPGLLQTVRVLQDIVPACLIAALSHICSRTFLDLTVMAWVIRTTCSLSDMLRSLWLDLHSALPLGVSCSPLFPPQVPSQGISCLFFGTCLTGHSLSRKFSVTPPSPLPLSHSPPQLGIGVSLLHSTAP